MSSQSIETDNTPLGGQYNLFSLLGLKPNPSFTKTKHKKTEYEQYSHRLAFGVKETAHTLGIGMNSVYNLINGGLLPSFKVGTRRLVSAEAVNNFIAKSEQEENYYA